MAGRSAAYVVAIVAVLGFIIGALVLTVVDPVMQALFSSSTWTSSTSEGTDLLMWMNDGWAFVGAAILVALLVQVWVDTRQTT